MSKITKTPNVNNHIVWGNGFGLKEFKLKTRSEIWKKWSDTNVTSLSRQITLDPSALSKNIMDSRN